MQITIDLEKYLPKDLDLMSTLFFVATFCVGILIIGILARLFLGKGSSLNGALSTSLAILVIYALTVVVHTFQPHDLERYLSPLPFITFAEDKLVLFSLSATSLPEICYQILSMILLAYLVNLVELAIPDGTRVLGWFIYRSLAVVGAMAAHYLVHRLIQYFIPGFLEGYAPMILLGILVFLFGLGLIRLLLGFLLTAVNPLVGAVYAFFFASKGGKQISKALFSTAILIAFVAALEYFGYGVIAITPEALGTYLPFAGILTLLWFLIGYVL